MNNEVMKNINLQPVYLQNIDQTLINCTYML